MANLITQDYFFGDLNLAQLSQQPVQQDVLNFITKYETEYLQKVLGYPLWKAFIAGLAEDPIDSKWIELRDGAEFTHCNKVQKWNGFKAVTPAEGKPQPPLYSPIANYVYVKYIRDQITSTAGTGQVKKGAINAVNANPQLKITRAWNEMVVLNRSLHSFITANADIYTGYEVSKYMMCKINEFDL